MNAAIAVLFALMLSGAMVSIVLALAWRRFGRPAHAATWAIAFAIGTVGWAVNIVYFAFYRGDPILIALIHSISMVSAAMMTQGFLQRSGRAWRAWLLPGVTGAAILCAAVVTIKAHHAGMAAAIPSLFSCMMNLLALAGVRRPGRAVSTAERAAMVLFALFAVFDFGAIVIGLKQGPGGDAYYVELFSMAMLLGLPAAYTGVGLFAVFLLASDLAEAMEKLAATDVLTGVLNRRGFELAATRALANAARQGQPLSLVVIDLDHFKAINDRHGHAAGDRALICFAAHVQRAIRTGDLVARIGGEEFGLLLVNSSIETTMTVTERLRAEIAQLVVDGDPPFSVTASFGVTELEQDEAASVTLGDLMLRADRALYRSKLEGRNRVTLAEDVPAQPEMARE